MRVKVEDEKIYLCKVKCQHVFFGIHSVNGHTDLSLIFHNIFKLSQNLHGNTNLKKSDSVTVVLFLTRLHERKC